MNLGKQIFWQDISIEEKLGEGSFSKVYKMVNMKTGEIFALKEMKKPDRKDLLNELLPPNLVHKNLIKCKAVFMAERPIQLQLLDKEQREENFFSSDSDQSNGSNIMEEVQISKDADFSAHSLTKKEFFYIVSDFCESTLSNFIRLRNDFLSNLTTFEQSNLEIKTYTNSEHKNISKAEMIKKNKNLNLFDRSIVSFCRLLKPEKSNNPSQKNKKKSQEFIKMHHFDSHLSFLDISMVSNPSCPYLKYSIRFDKNRLIINRLFCSELFRDIVRGVLYLHQNNIVHYDIKSNNILLKCSEKSIVPKICDFGLRKTKNNVESDLRGLGLIYFEILHVSSTVMEFDKEKRNLKQSGIFPPFFEEIFEMESKLILRCMDKRKKRVSDTRNLLYDVVSVCDTLRLSDPDTVD